MTRRKVEAAILNIKIHPHSPDLYVKLLNKVHSSGNHVKIRDKYYGTIGWLNPLKKDGKTVILEGEIYKYLNIDPTRQWLDKQKNIAIKIEEGGTPPPVPESLKPHLQEIYFIFHPKKHRLVFESNNLSPTAAHTLFEGLINHPTIIKEFNPADIHIESSKETIERILQLPRLAKLEITIAMPNPDDTGLSDEEKVLARMDEEGARRVFERKTAFKGKTLTPDEKTRTMMKVATSNGKVYAEGYDEGETRIIESTEAHPLRDKDYYNPDKINIYKAFKTLAKRMLTNIGN